jgi:hypothetical protein
MNLKIISVIIFLIALFIYLLLTKEKFTNYLSVADNRDLYVRFLDYLHGGYTIPEKYRRGYFIYDIYGFPHYVDYRADPYFFNINKNQNFMPSYQGFIWQQPHDRKIIKI